MRRDRSLHVQFAWQSIRMGLTDHAPLFRLNASPIPFESTVLQWKHVLVKTTRHRSEPEAAWWNSFPHPVTHLSRALVDDTDPIPGMICIDFPHNLLRIWFAPTWSGGADLFYFVCTVDALMIPDYGVLFVLQLNIANQRAIYCAPRAISGPLWSLLSFVVIFPVV